MTLEEKIKKMEEFASKHGIEFSHDGTAGFREAVGYTYLNNYIMYKPLNMSTYEEIPGFEDDSIGDRAPEDAHHKVQCLAVLVKEGGNEVALDQLYDWTMDMEGMGVEFKTYRTEAVGVQAMLSGTTGMAVRKAAE